MVDGGWWMVSQPPFALPVDTRPAEHLHRLQYSSSIIIVIIFTFVIIIAIIIFVIIFIIIFMIIIITIFGPLWPRRNRWAQYSLCSHVLGLSQCLVFRHLFFLISLLRFLLYWDHGLALSVTQPITTPVAKPNRSKVCMCVSNLLHVCQSCYKYISASVK